MPSPASAPLPTERPSQRFGAYVVLGELGRGGQGVVLRARHERLGTAVALKLPLDAEPRAVRRFEQEAKVLAELRHPNLPQVFDLGEEAGRPYLAMELVEGEDLGAIVSSRGRPPFDWTARVLEAVARALHHCHERGIVHRDLKPSNIIVERVTGRPVVVDFGLLKRDPRSLTLPETAAAEAISESGGLQGTPLYMAPEQIDPESFGGVGPAADVYALGATLHFLLTGSPPFRAERPLEVVARVLCEEPPDASRAHPDVPETLAGLCREALAKAPAGRPVSAEAFADALRDRSTSTRAAAAVLPSPRSGRTNLPARLDAFVGREDELAAISALLEGGARLVTFTGAGGTGKTRLAQRFGALHLGDLAGGVWFCDLALARDLEGLCAAVARGLDVPLAHAEPVSRLGRVLAARGRALVILDNVEQVVEHAPATVGRWVLLAPEATFLATSREPLGLAGERLLRVEPLPVPPGDLRPTPEALGGSAAAALFLTRAREAEPAFELSVDEAPAVAEIVRRLDGIPLAIELAASRVRVLTPRRILERLPRRFDLLASGPRDASPRHATLRAAIDASWQLLAPWEQAALAQCSVFRGGFSLTSAEAVLDLRAWREAPWTLDVIEVLHRKSVLRASRPTAAANGEVRFAFYESIREYAAEKLREPDGLRDGAGREASGPGPLAAVLARHAAHFAAFGSDAWIDSLSSHGGRERYAELALDLPNLLAAAEHSLAIENGALAAGACRAACHVLAFEGPVSLAVDLAERTLRLPGLSDGQRARLFGALGVARRDAGRPAEGLLAHREARELALRTGDRALECLGYAQIAVCLIDQGRLEEARAECDAGLAVVREHGPRRVEGPLLRVAGVIAMVQGRIGEARRHLEEALRLDSEAGNLRGQAMDTLNLATLVAEQGDLPEGKAHCDAALRLFRLMGDKRCEGLGLLNLAHYLKELGRAQEALAHFESGVRLLREVGDQANANRALGDLGALLLQELGRPGEARRHLEEALTLHRESGNVLYEGRMLEALGELALAEGRPDDAQRFLEEAVARLGSARDAHHEGTALGALAEAHLARGALARARECIERGEALLRRVAKPFPLALLLCRRGPIDRAAENPDAARAALAEVEAIRSRLGVSGDSRLVRELERLRELVG